jgi:hypothetical protein
VGPGETVKANTYRGARLAGLGDKLEPLLADLERRGIGMLSYFDPWPTSTTEAQLGRLGVAGLFPFASSDPRIFLEAIGGGASRGPDDIVKAINGYFADPGSADVVAKLAAAREVTERHVFLWVRPFRWRAWRALGWEGLPTTPPSLPEPVTAVWVAVKPDWAWLYHRATGWRAVGDIDPSNL